MGGWHACPSGIFCYSRDKPVVQIAPFQALRYNPNVISFISRVIAPPYDVIDKEDAERLRERDRHNVVRLILGRHDATPRTQNTYQRAARYLDSWRKDKVLVRDPSPAVYVIEQRFAVGEHAFVRHGVICALLLQDFASGGVLPHEHTVSAARIDRFELMQACKTAISPVFAIHSDADGHVNAFLTGMTGTEPTFEYCDEDGVVLRLWMVTDPGSIATLAGHMKNETLVIADGHHRYETALRFRDESRDATAPPGQAPEDYAMVFCVSVRNRGLQVLATHRLARSQNGFDTDSFLTALEDFFSIERIRVPGAEQLGSLFDTARGAEPCIGCYVRDQLLCMLRPKGPEILDGFMPDASSALRRLPVAQLHYAVLEPFFAISAEAGNKDERLAFSRNPQEMFWSVESSRFDAAFLLPPVSPDALTQVAFAGDRMPSKSTFFFPKIPSGLVFYPFDGGAHLPLMPGA